MEISRVWGVVLSVPTIAWRQIFYKIRTPSRQEFRSQLHQDDSELALIAFEPSIHLIFVCCKSAVDDECQTVRLDSYSQ